MRAPKWLVANDPHPAYSDWDGRDGLTETPKVMVRMDEYPRLAPQPVHPTPPTEPVLPKTHDESKAPFIACTVVLVVVFIILGWTAFDLLAAGVKY
ncbi:hypothetical protein [Mycetocola miduiensis]|uniref:Uncharacterized protein n=1 Tax=Mycetocola miduiensis TaxID=995034 RepID=A0A1I5AX25_9MICO|nr:hypothetical protein [Mycetocola miduiensis]SFN66962.1 hypothetical protein SAMN05216219_1589 [Mycetocola miduiensis]